MKRLSAIAAAALCALFPLSASAVTFDLTFEPPNNPTLNLSSGGINLLITAATFVDNGGGSGTIDLLGPTDAAELRFNAAGMGVSFDGTDGAQIDGMGANDLAIFDFGQTVSLDLIQFAAANQNDEFVLFVGNSLAALTSFSFLDIPQPSDQVAPGVIGRFFGIGALEDNDNYRIASVDVSEVPIPGAIPLFLAGLAGLSFARRQRRQRG